MSPVPEDVCLLASPSLANVAEIYVFGDETKDERTGSVMLRSVAGLSPAVTCTSGPIQRRMLYQTLCLASEEMVLPLKAGSSSRHSETFDNRAADMKTVQLVDKGTQGGYDIIADEEDDHPVVIGPDGEDSHRLRVVSREEEENLPLLPASPLVERPIQEVAERPSMTSRLIGILRGVSNLTTAIRGTFLARHCSLSRTKENRDLQWGRALGTSKYGRVTLVQHELGPFAVKELTEVGTQVSLVLFHINLYILSTNPLAPESWSLSFHSYRRFVYTTVAGGLL